MSATATAAAGAGDDTEVLALHGGPVKEYEADAPVSAEQLALVAQLKDIVKDVEIHPDDVEYWSSDHALRRFLVARGLKVDAAAAMFRETMHFRRERNCSSLLSTHVEPLALRHYFPWGIVGLDKEGFPVLVERVGAIDLIGINSAVGTEDFLTWVCWYHEVQERIMRRISAKLGRDRHKMTCIIDLSGLSMRHLSSGTLNVLKRRTRLEEDNFPEVVKRVFIVNTPSMFATVWGVVKLFMDQGTVDKLQLLGSNYMPTLLKYVDASVIPKFLGGELVDSTGDSECKSLIAPGGLVPQAYIAGIATDGRGMGEEVNISAGKHSDVLLHVPAGATVRWNFATQEKEVNFRVTVAPSNAVPSGTVKVASTVYGVHQLAVGYAGPKGGVTHVSTSGDLHASVPGGGVEHDVINSSKIEKHAGEHTVEVDSVVRLRWDNSFSWMASKTLVRRVDVIVPGKETEPMIENDGHEEAARRRQANYENFGL